MNIRQRQIKKENAKRVKERNYGWLVGVSRKKKKFANKEFYKKYTWRIGIEYKSKPNGLIDNVIFKYKNGSRKPRKIYHIVKDLDPNNLSEVVDKTAPILQEIYKKEGVKGYGI